MMYLKKIIPCSLVAILLSCSEVKLPDFDVYAEGQKEVLDALDVFEIDFLKPSIEKRLKLISAYNNAEIKKDQLPRDVLTVLLMNEDDININDDIIKIIDAKIKPFKLKQFNERQSYKTRNYRTPSTQRPYAFNNPQGIEPIDWWESLWKDYQTKESDASD